MNPGDRFGKLTAVQFLYKRATKSGRMHHIWRMICDCGTEVERSKENVQSSFSQGSSPCCDNCFRRSPPPRTDPIRLNLSGQKFGKLTAIAPTGQVDKKRYSIWLFRCECGKEVKKSAGYVVQSFKRGRIPSCSRSSCNSHPKLGFGEASKRAVISNYRRAAEKRGYSFDITDEQAETLLKGACHYCGAGPSSRSQRGRAYGYFDYNGIDRKNNARGYTPENCVSCCRRCNYAKKDMEYEEFTKWLDQLVSFRSPTRIENNENAD